MPNWPTVDNVIILQSLDEQFCEATVMPLCVVCTTGSADSCSMDRSKAPDKRFVEVTPLAGLPQ